jgi:murein DD-endopeptidase MepM/ murein hydrolase activator NlpD
MRTEGCLHIARWLAALVLIALPTAPAHALEVRFAPASPSQGDVAVVSIASVRDARDVEGNLGGRSLHFFPSNGGYTALGGIDLDRGPGKMPWQVEVIDATGDRHRASGTVLVRSGKFSVERLTLPKGMVDLDPDTERRADQEAARLRALYASVTPERLWAGKFTRPLPSQGSGSGFGSRRIINGQPRAPHSGVDFSADRGTPVVAANRGRVALIGELFFAGRCVILDHGLGLYTLYFHLDRVDAAEGALVERGAVIGVVGATGRATGPHLHWGAQLGGARIDPRALLSLPLAD